MNVLICILWNILYIFQLRYTRRVKFTSYYFPIPLDRENQTTESILIGFRRRVGSSEKNGEKKPRESTVFSLVAILVFGQR